MVIYIEGAVIRINRNRKIIVCICLFIIILFGVHAAIKSAPSVEKAVKVTSETSRDSKNLYKENLQNIFNGDLKKFLYKMPKDNGNFSTMRLDFNQLEGNLDQTYYNLLLQKMFSINSSSGYVGNFLDKLLKKCIKDSSYDCFLDIVAEQKNLPQTYNKMFEKIYQEYKYQLSCDYSKKSPYLVYHLSKWVCLAQKNKDVKSIEILGDYLLKEPKGENLLYYTYWYFDLINLGFSPSHNNEAIIKKTLNFINGIKYKELNDVQTLYNYLQISAWVGNRTTLSEADITSLKDSLSYTFNAQELYFKIKILEFYDKNTRDKFRNFFEQYYKALKPMKDSLYPMCVIEDNNKVEMLNWQILISNLLKLDDKNRKDLSSFLLKYISESKPAASTIETYYQVLLCYLTNNKYPLGKITYIKNSLKKGKSVMDNYYLYQAYNLLGMKLSSQEIQKLKVESKLFFSKKDEWGIVGILDIWNSFGLDESFAQNYWNKSKDLLEKKANNMTDETFFHYQIIKRAMGDYIKQTDIDNHFKVRKVDKMYIIKGERGEMDIGSIYYYAALMKMLTIDDKDFFENKTCFVYR